MGSKYLFADVDLPFHVWVRESTAAGERWVLREAPHAGQRLSQAGPIDDEAAASYTNCRLQPTLPTLPPA